MLPPASRVLVVVPDPDLCGSLSAQLRLAGYAVMSAATGAAAVDLLDACHIDLIVVDMDIPDLDDLARNRPVLAERPSVLCVVPCESLDRLVPEVGRDVEDYVTKPCRVTELLARVQVLLRARAATREPVLRYGDLLLDEVVYQAWRGERALEVTPAEYRLLRQLLVNAGRVLSKEQLAWQVWNESRGVNAIERLVSRLRQKVDEAGPPLIHTRRGFGYWLGAPHAGW